MVNDTRKVKIYTLKYPDTLEVSYNQKNLGEKEVRLLKLGGLKEKVSKI